MDADAAVLTDAADEEYLDYNSQRVIERCAEEGLVVDFPRDDELQIDVDSHEDWQRFTRSFAILARELGVEARDMTVTTSRRKAEGRHVRVRLPFPVVPWQRIAFQAALGSDPVREILSCVRLQNGDPRPTLFIENPDWKGNEV